MLERYTHPTDAETRRAVESASRLTRVGTKTGTPTTPRTAGEGHVVRRWLEWNELVWRPQRDSNPCLSLERANQPKSEPTQNQRFTNTTNNLDPIQLSLDLTPDHDTET